MIHLPYNWKDAIVTGSYSEPRVVATYCTRLVTVFEFEGDERHSFHVDDIQMEYRVFCNGEMIQDWTPIEHGHPFRYFVF